LQEDFPGRESPPRKEGILAARLTNINVDIPIDKTTKIYPTIRDLRLRLIYDPGGLNGSWSSTNNTLLFNTAPLAPVQMTVYHETVHMFADLVSDSLPTHADNATSEALTRDSAFAVLSQYADTKLSLKSNLNASQLDKTTWGATTVRDSFISSVTKLHAATSVQSGQNTPSSRKFARRSWDLLRGELIARVETALMMGASEKPTTLKKALRAEVGDISSWARAYWSQVIGSTKVIDSIAGRAYIRTELRRILGAVAAEYLRLRNHNFR